MSAIEQGIQQKIISKGVPLKQWNISINFGIKTGFNDAFVIDTNTKNRLIEDDPKSAEIIRPILRGRDIKRYEYTFADLWMICTFPSRHYNIDDFPAIKKYLLSFGMEHLEQSGKTYIVNNKKISARKKTTNKWFETQDNISYWDDFSKQKIVYREISEQMDACLIDDEVYINNKCYIITGQNLKQLICYLNSKLFNKLILCEANLTGGKGIGFISRIKLLPLTKPSNLDNLYDSLLNSANRTEIDNQIDEIIYDLFNLNTGEKDYIRNL